MEDVPTSQPWWAGVILKDPIEIMNAPASKFVPRGRLGPQLTYVLVDLRGRAPLFLKNSLEGADLWVIIGEFRNLEFVTLTVVVGVRHASIAVKQCFEVDFSRQNFDDAHTVHT